MKRKNNFIANIANILLIVFLIGALGSILDIDFLKRKDEGPVHQEQTQETRIAVPTSGYVNNIYFNSELTKDEVEEILSSLPFMPIDGIEVFNSEIPLVIDSTITTILFVQKTLNEDGIYVYNIFYSSVLEDIEIVIFNSENGWISDFDYMIRFNTENFVSLALTEFGFESQNDKIKNLVYTYNSELNLTPNYLNGTAVPNSGYVEKVYFNTSLTNLDMLRMLAGNEDLMGEAINVLVASETDSKIAESPFLFFAVNPENYQVTIYGKSALDDKITVYFDENGWNEDYINGFVVNHEVYSDFTDIPGQEHGKYNDLLVNIISLTPFN